MNEAYINYGNNFTYYEQKDIENIKNSGNDDDSPTLLH